MIWRRLERQNRQDSQEDFAESNNLYLLFLSFVASTLSVLRVFYTSVMFQQKTCRMIQTFSGAILSCELLATSICFLYSCGFVLFVALLLYVILWLCIAEFKSNPSTKCLDVCMSILRRVWSLLFNCHTSSLCVVSGCYSTYNTCYKHFATTTQ